MRGKEWGNGGLRKRRGEGVGGLQGWGRKEVGRWGEGGGEEED